MPSLCASCETFSLDRPVVSSSEKKPEWLKKKNHVKEFIKTNTSFKARRPADADQEVKISFGKDYAGRHVLYWAAESSSSLLVSDAKTAYDDFSNNGITTLDSKGNALIYLRCPQIYSTREDGSSETKSFFRHFHMTLANEHKQEWEDRVFTQLLIAKRSFLDLFRSLRSGHQITLNATCYKDEEKNQMPWYEVMTSEQVKGMEKIEVQRFIRKICHTHYPRLSELLKMKKLHISEVPIICYSFDPEYEDSPRLARELVDKGFLRVDILFSKRNNH